MKFSDEQIKETWESLIADKSKIKFAEFSKGIQVELEHGKINSETNITDDDPIKTAKIAIAHLNEIPDYYTRLARMEEEGKKAKRNQEITESAIDDLVNLFRR